MEATKKWERILAKARAMGKRRGEAYVDCQYLPGGGRDTARDAAGRAAKMLAGYDDSSDDTIGDMVPSWLSGEWADDPVCNDVLSALGIEEDADGASDALSEYENAATDAFIDGIVAHLRSVAKGGK